MSERRRLLVTLASVSQFYTTTYVVLFASLQHCAIEISGSSRCIRLVELVKEQDTKW